MLSIKPLIKDIFLPEPMKAFDGAVGDVQ